MPGHGQRAGGASPPVQQTERGQKSEPPAPGRAAFPAAKRTWPGPEMLRDLRGTRGDPLCPLGGPGALGGGSSEVASGRWLREPAGTRAAAVPRAGHGEGATDSPGCPPPVAGCTPKARVSPCPQVSPPPGPRIAGVALPRGGCAPKGR